MDKSAFNDAVRARLIGLCAEANISWTKLAEMADVTHSTVYALLSGEYGSPRVSTLFKFCKVFGLTMDKFFDDELFNCIFEEDEIREDPVLERRFGKNETVRIG